MHHLCKDNNFSCYIGGIKLLIQDLPTGELLYKGNSEIGLYPIRTALSSLVSTHKPLMSASFKTKVSHPYSSKRRKVPHSVTCSSRTSTWCCSKSNFLNTFGYLRQKNVSLCRHCICGKMTQFPFDKSSFKSAFPIKLIHTDVWDQGRISINGHRYYVLFVNDYTRFSWFLFLKHKYALLSTFINIFIYQKKHNGKPVI